MKKNIKKTMKGGKKIRKKDVEKNFYELYFQDVSIKHNISIEQFYLPKNSQATNQL